VRTRRRIVLLVVVLAVALVVPLLSRECASGGAMAGRYQTCTCRGVEWLVADQTAADGPRRTICFGWITARACYEHRDGPPIACPTAR
jgi:hypothetical protein